MCRTCISRYLLPDYLIRNQDFVEVDPAFFASFRAFLESALYDRPFVPGQILPKVPSFELGFVLRLAIKSLLSRVLWQDGIFRNDSRGVEVVLRFHDHHDFLSRFIFCQVKLLDDFLFGDPVERHGCLCLDSAFTFAVQEKQFRRRSKCEGILRGNEGNERNSNIFPSQPTHIWKTT